MSQEHIIHVARAPSPVNSCMAANLLFATDNAYDIGAAAATFTIAPLSYDSSQHPAIVMR